MRTRDIAIGVVLTVAAVLEAALSNSRDGSVALNVLLYGGIGLIFLLQPLRPFELTLALFVAVGLASIVATDVVALVHVTGPVGDE